MIETILTALAFHFERYWREYALGVVCLASVSAIGYYEFLTAPVDFPVGQDIIVAKGASLPAIAAALASEHVIDHPQLFELIVRLMGGAGRLQAGPYRFSHPADVLVVAERLRSGISGIPAVRITFAEGESVRTMAAIAAKRFADISASDFVAAGGAYEGYLFPDTYTFAPSATPEQIVATMRANFDAKTFPLQSAIAGSGHTISDVVIMASLVEKEARTPADMQMVAGILWNRIAKGIPLQVDAPFGYLQGKDEYSPSLVDLSIDSPYNTYKHKGLPPTPIGNPGLTALGAAISPTKSNYLFYLSGRDGQMHYATTYAQHLANERKYLN
jgi:UPF0755 protein